MIRQTLLMASRSEGLKNLAANTPVTRSVVERYVAGETTGDAVRVAAELADGGMLSTIDHLGRTRSASSRPTASGTPTWTFCAAWTRPGWPGSRKSPSSCRQSARPCPTARGSPPRTRT